MKHDFKGNNKADILVTSPWGLGILSPTAGSLTALTMAANGTRFGGWLLNSFDNNIELKADFDGDGRTEILISSPWGIGILKLINGNLTSIAMAQNGTRLGGWIINTFDNQLLHAADFDRDGREEILITSPWGIGILKYFNNTITSLMLLPNGTRLGGWLLNTADDNFTLVGDFDGDGQTEIVASSGWGLGILKYNGSTLTSVAMIPNGTHCGNWTLNTATDRLEAVGDFDGDQSVEILVSNGQKMGILKLRGNALTSLSVASTGSRLGSWSLSSGTDKMNTVGDFDGDGRAEILVSNSWGIGVLKLNDGTLQSSMTAINGTRFGGWLLNTRDNRLNYAADFDGDGQIEIQITSPWGIGILKQSGTTFNTLMMSPNGTRFGGWLLNTADNDLESGLGQSFGLFIYHEHWNGSIHNTTNFLRRRGYTMYAIPNGAQGIEILKKMALNLKASDRLFVYLAGHGATGRGLSDLSKGAAMSHIFQFQDGDIHGLDQFAPSFQLLGNKGIDLTVLDGSCEGGETVINAIGERYVAFSATGTHGPAITNDPDPSVVMEIFGKPCPLGLWWSPYYGGSLMTSKTVNRFHQKIYRNDNTEMSMQSLFYKTAIGFYGGLGGSWEMMVRRCYLLRYVYPDVYNSLEQVEKDATTDSAVNFLAGMRRDLNDMAQMIINLRSTLGNTSLVIRAAEFYGRHYPKPWQTMYGDMNWNVAAEPLKYKTATNTIVPTEFAGSAGFVRMVNEILNSLNFLQAVYNTQESQLSQIDAEIMRLRIFTGIFRIPLLPKKNITDYLQYNEYYLKTISQVSITLGELNLDTNKLFKTMRKPVGKVSEKMISNFIKTASTTSLEYFRGEKSEFLESSDSASINTLIAQYKNLSSWSSTVFNRLHFILIVVEEAISWAQASGAESGDLVKY